MIARLVILFGLCLAVQGQAYDFYPASAQTSRTNQMAMFVELWNSTLEHQLAVNAISNTAQAAIVHDYPVYAGTTSTVFAVTNVTAGVTNTVTLTNQYKTFLTVRRTNQFESWTYSTNGVETVNYPWVWAEDVINLHARIWTLISGQNASFMDHTRAGTNGVFFSTNASVLANSFPVTATGLFQRLGIGIVTNVGTARPQDWTVTFTGFEPAPDGGDQPLYEGVNSEENWDWVLYDFTNETLNGVYGYEGIELDSWDLPNHVWRNGAATIVVYSDQFSESPGEDANSAFPVLITGTLDSYGEPYWFGANYGDGEWVGTDGSTGQGLRTNLTFAFQELRRFNAPELQGEALVPQLRYYGASTSEASTVTVTLQGSAKLTNHITHGVEETIAVSANPVATNVLTLQWRAVTQVVVTGSAQGYDTLAVVYPQPAAQSWVSYPTKIEYWMYNEFALVLDALRWTCLSNRRFSNATWNGGSGLGCTWEAAVAAAEADSNNAFTNSSDQFSAPRKATQGEYWSGECATGIMLRATWQTVSSSAVLTNLTTNVAKTVDTYLDISATGIFDDNGIGWTQGFYRVASTDAGLSAGVSNVLGDVSHTPGNWEYITPTGQNARGFGSVTRWQAVVKWDFTESLP